MKKCKYERKGKNILNLEDPPYTTEIERAEWATRVLKLDFVKTIPFTYKMLETFEGEHRRLDFPVDGAVISVNSLELQEDCGRSGNKDTGNPKGKIAFKSPDSSLIIVHGLCLLFLGNFVYWQIIK